MTQIRSFKQIFEQVSMMGRKKRIAVVCPDDECTIEAVAEAHEMGLADFILFSTLENLKQIPESLAGSAGVSMHVANDADDAAYKAVEAVRTGEADVLMKGLIPTDNYLRAILNKEHGILPQGAVLTHLAVAEVPSYHKLLFFSDVAVIPYPTLQQRIATISYDLETIRRFGVERPKVALIHFTEKVNEKFPNSVQYVEIERMAAEGYFGEVAIGGPMDVKAACDSHSAQVKGIVSEVCGDADLLIFPNIESGNTFYKTITYFAGAGIAGIIQGAKCPVILTSRSDTHQSKLTSVAIACLSA